jgi:outer membrane protein assembly factor BamB
LTGDGRLEVIFGSNNGWLYVLSGDSGEELFRYRTEGVVRASPVMGDIDGDGRLELVVCGGSKVYVFDTDASGPAWPMFKRDIYNRGNLSLDSLELPLGSRDTPAPADRWVKLRLAFSVYGLDTLEYLAYEIEKMLLRPLGLRLFDYIY